MSGVGRIGTSTSGSARLPSTGRRPTLAALLPAAAGNRGPIIVAEPSRGDTPGVGLEAVRNRSRPSQLRFVRRHDGQGGLAAIVRPQNRPEDDLVATKCLLDV